MKKTTKFLLVVLTFAIGFALVSCKEEGGKKETEELAEKQELTVCFAGDPESIDPALNASVDGANVCVNAFAGLYSWTTVDGSVKLVAECAQEIVKPTAAEGGKYKYVITLKEGLKWSDGSELYASDFVYAWNRAASPETAADYCYMFDVIDGYASVEAEEAGAKLNVTADNNNRTITIYTTAYCAYFDQLLAFPTYFPVKESVVSADANWATKQATYVSNGAFRMKTWVTGSKIEFEKNPNYHDAENVKLDKLTFFLSEDDDAVYANFQSGDVQYTTHVPVTQIPVLKADSTKFNKTFFIGDYIGTWYLEFNINNSFKPGLTNAGTTTADWQGWSEENNAKARQALGMLIDRNYIVNSVTAGGQTPARGFVPNGMSDGNGNEFRSEAQDWWSVDSAEYEETCQEAVNILKGLGYTFDNATGKFTNFPQFVVKMNNTSGNTAILTAVQSMWAKYGINFTIDSRAWNILTKEVGDGDFGCSRLGWIADYDDPVNFLEIYLSASGNNHPQLGKDKQDTANISSGSNFGPNYNQPWSDYDEIISKIKTEADPAKRAEYLYQAEEWLYADCPIIPIYYYTNPYLCASNLKGFTYTNTGMVYFKTAYLTK